MNTKLRMSILFQLVRRLREQESWCGETHVQKASFFVQQLHGSNEFPFILYKHGPYSFGVRDTLEALRSYRILGYEIQAQGYGPRFAPLEPGIFLQESEKEASAFLPVILFVAKRLGNKGVTDLERYATALYFTKSPDPPHDRVAEIRRVKPHISTQKAEEAVRWVDELIHDAHKKRLAA
jgi:uncharacterized protein YwgA